MLCKIADLIVDIPATDGLDRRCGNYLTTEKAGADIIIRTQLYRRGIYSPRIPDSTVAYMESGHQFHLELLNHNGFFLHSSAVVVDGKAYLFSGDSGENRVAQHRYNKVYYKNSKLTAKKIFVIIIN